MPKKSALHVLVSPTDVYVEGAKRFHMPLVITGICPNCGEGLTMDLTDQYLGNPVWNDWSDEWLLCFNCEEAGYVEENVQYEFPIRVKLVAHLEISSPLKEEEHAQGGQEEPLAENT